MRGNAVNLPRKQSPDYVLSQKNRPIEVGRMSNKNNKDQERRKKCCWTEKNGPTRRRAIFFSFKSADRHALFAKFLHHEMMLYI